jgi:hypothetical protein
MLVARLEQQRQPRGAATSPTCPYVVHSHQVSGAATGFTASAGINVATIHSVVSEALGRVAALCWGGYAILTMRSA